jgi:hypothetical protein
MRVILLFLKTLVFQKTRKKTSGTLYSVFKEPRPRLAAFASHPGRRRTSGASFNSIRFTRTDQNSDFRSPCQARSRVPISSRGDGYRRQEAFGKIQPLRGSGTIGPAATGVKNFRRRPKNPVSPDRRAFDFKPISRRITRTSRSGFAPTCEIFEGSSPGCGPSEAGSADRAGASYNRGTLADSSPLAAPPKTETAPARLARRPPISSWRRSPPRCDRFVRRRAALAGAWGSTTTASCSSEPAWSARDASPTGTSTRTTAPSATRCWRGRCRPSSTPASRCGPCRPRPWWA